MDTTDFEAMERDGWSDPGIAKGYATAFDRATRKVACALADCVGAKRGMRVLDLCSGHGVVATELVRRGASVTGLDFSPAMVSLAEAAVPDALFVQGDAMAMAFAEASFDAVTIGFGVPHMPDPRAGLAEVCRVLKPGGRVAFSIWRGQGSEGAFGWLFDAYGRHCDSAISLPEGPDAHQFVDAELANGTMAAAGFADVKLHDVASDLWVAAPEDLFDVFYQGAVRAAALLGGQSEETRALVRNALAKQVRREGRPCSGGALVSAPSVVVTGKKA